MEIDNLKRFAKNLKQALACPHCEGSVMIAATSHKGHGIGLHGSANYRATEFEAANPTKHCTCPGGPLWSSILNSPLGNEFKLEEAQARYPNLTSDLLPVWNPEIEQWCSIPKATWRKAVIAAFDETGRTQSRASGSNIIER